MIHAPPYAACHSCQRAKEKKKKKRRVEKQKLATDDDDTRGKNCTASVRIPTAEGDMMLGEEEQWQYRRVSLIGSVSERVTSLVIFFLAGPARAHCPHNPSPLLLLVASRDFIDVLQAKTRAPRNPL